MHEFPWPLYDEEDWTIIFALNSFRQNWKKKQSNNIEIDIGYKI